MFLEKFPYRVKFYTKVDGFRESIGMRREGGGFAANIIRHFLVMTPHLV